MSTATQIDEGAKVRAERLADEQKMKRMSHASMARRAVCPRCGCKDSYTYRRNGEPLFSCYACCCAFDESGAQR